MMHPKRRIRQNSIKQLTEIIDRTAANPSAIDEQRKARELRVARFLMVRSLAATP
jgi:hypothetical protein